MSYVLTCLLAVIVGSRIGDAPLPFRFSAEAAVKYGEAALIEFSDNSGYALDRAMLANPPRVVAGLTTSGERVVLVLYTANPGSYFVCLTANKDSNLTVRTRGHSIETVAVAAAEFLKRPSVFLDEGDD